ncbi:hypothetical protein [Methylosinus sp. Ce-a6]|uniref:hypothetical protein n=1 Tax=Methylosinus sp. Ce-a6 TaxID=2172005 RepID=UPI0013588241|nr:hypothetical protein [Methylosinus sp. Ce-a6]
MTPAAARAALDRMLSKAGQSATLVRLWGTSRTPVSVALRVHIVVDYRPEQIIDGSGLQIGFSKAIISTTEINAASWPGVALAGDSAPPGDPRVPRKGDELRLASGARRVVVAAWEAPRIQGDLIRIEMTVK